MPLDRRALFAAGLGVAAAAAGPRPAAAGSSTVHAAADAGLEPDAERDQTNELQAAIDACASRGAPLILPSGRFRVGHIVLRSGSRIVGAHGTTVLEFTGGRAFVTASDAEDIALEKLTLDGGLLALDPEMAGGLISLTRCRRISIRDVAVSRSLLNAVSLIACSGRVTDATFETASQAGIFARDSVGLEIAHNIVAGCGNNGILVWRETEGEDGTIVAGNRIERIEARAGGSGEYGNGINVFRAGGVLVTGNRISDCAYSAIRANAASDVQMVANSCARLGEVALYAEFAFEGALIANNLVQGAASGIAVTNFDQGGRLAVVSGNMIRNLKRREMEPVDKRGEGISVEADAVVTGNVVENAATAGIVVGWGKHMRDVSVTQNLIRGARVGIMVTADPGAGSCLIAQNLISGAEEGGIRAMNHGILAGPDLAREPASTNRIAISGNRAV
jgi:uncharacterized secreted repeat protein (TIGR03808 family)